MRTSLLLALFMLGTPALAQNGGLIFEQTEIRIAAAPSTPKDGEVTLQRPPVPLSIELRGEDALRLEYIHTLNTLTPDSGVMIALSSPATIALPVMKVYTPIDALFIAEDGTITEIFPNITLADMPKSIAARSPVKAMLFLKSGSAAAFKLHPKDVVSGKIFNPASAVQN